MVLITIIGCSMLTLCAASAFVGMPKPFSKRKSRRTSLSNGDVEEQLLVSILEEDDDEKEEEEEEEEEEDRRNKRKRRSKLKKKERS